MKIINKYIQVFIFFLWGMSFMASAQILKHERLFSFEEQTVFDSIESQQSIFSISTKHNKDGKQSLRWEFNPNGSLSFKKNLSFEKKDPKGEDLYLSTFIVWVYNEHAVNKTVRFEFLKDGKVCTSFPFYINFTGWRAAWVAYERDMQGTPEEGMNEIRITAPDMKGELYIDHLITAAKVDPRHQTPDVQIPFVNKKTMNHWMVLYHKSKLRPDIELRPVTATDKQDFKEIESRFRKMIYTPQDLSEQEITAIRKKYQEYGIEYVDGCIHGVPLFFNAIQAFERLFDLTGKDTARQAAKLGVAIKDYFNWMKRVAVAYNNAPDSLIKTEMKDKFLAMYDHAIDQGINYGSCWGNIHHYGYSMRNLYTACFLMKEVLHESQRLDEAMKMLQWYAITNDVFPKPIGNGINIDVLNTQITGRLASILIMNDTPEKVQYLKSFSRWMDYACRPSNGLSGGFKVDGSAFHHCNNYPAYATGGLTGVTDMIYLLSRTGFAVSELAHQTVKEVLLTMRFYCNKRSFPLSMSGRHPNGKGELIPEHYAIMAIAGSPDRKQEIDADMAEAYLRLTEQPYECGKQEKQFTNLLSAKGFTPEQTPEGNKAMGYACVSVQRRNTWSAVARGHSRYLWAAEQYLGANLFGRYLGHGSLQIMTAPQGEEVSSTSGGWQEEGFDWGRIPGTTAIHLPVDQLEANILNVDVFSGYEEMLYSDEAFAGGLSQERMNGNFGMKLHEHDKYNGSHRARKSYHFFDGTIVCLGSDIENTNSDYPTETTIFQLAVKNDTDRNFWKDYEGNEKYWIDPVGTGYYTPVATKFEKNFPQHSRMQNTGKENSGDWVALMIDHGKAPKGASYEYAVLPQTDQATMKAFAKKPSYKVLQKDRNAHIVRDLESNTISYVLFETPDVLPKGLIQKVDTSCLVMLRENKKEVILTVCQPDLALYRGSSDDIYDEQGKRIERSIYSRPWINNESAEIPVTIALKGQWKVTETPYCKLISVDKKQTVLRFSCRDAYSFDVVLRK